MLVDTSISLTAITTYLNMSGSRRMRLAMERLTDPSSIASPQVGPGLSISVENRSFLRGVGREVRKASESLTLAETADAALGKAEGILVRMRELAVNASIPAVGERVRGNLDDAFQGLGKELDSLAENTEFNGAKLLDGTLAAETAIRLAPGSASSTDGGTIQIGSVYASALGLAPSATSISTLAGAQSAITTLESAIGSVSEMRSRLGSGVNSLRHFLGGIQSAMEGSFSAKEGVSRENFTHMTEETQESIRKEPEVAIRSQANQRVQNALHLLK